MREYRPGNNRILTFQTTDQQRNFIDGKTKTVHTRIQFDMNREVGDSFFLGRLNQCIEQMEVVHFRFEFIIEHRFERCQFGVHDDNGGGDACFTQFGAFVGNGYSKVIYMMLLQCFGNLV